MFYAAVFAWAHATAKCYVAIFMYSERNDYWTLRLHYFY